MWQQRPVAPEEVRSLQFIIEQGKMFKVIEVAANFKSLTAACYIPAGTVIMECTGEATKIQGVHTVQLDDDMHYDMDCDARFTNHSCDPNSIFRIAGDKVDLVSIKDIAANEAITYDYNTTEYICAAPFTCQCKTEECIGEFRGFSYLSDARKKKLAPYLTPYIQKKFNGLSVK